MEPVRTRTSTEMPGTSEPTLPPPPPPSYPRTDHGLGDVQYRWPVAGQLTLGWRIATAIVWGFVFVGFVAVWKTSRELGLNTSWLGPMGEPASPIIAMVPFIAPLAMILLAINNVKWLPWFGLGAAAITAAVASLDLAKVPRLAIVEFVIAGAGALTAVAGFSGRYRR